MQEEEKSITEMGKKKLKKNKKQNTDKGKKKAVSKESDKIDKEWICVVCNSSFNDDEENEDPCDWVQCNMCKVTSHVNCIPLLHQNLFSFSPDDEEEYLCPDCYFIEDICT